MVDKYNETVTIEVEKRLEDLFGESEITPDFPQNNAEVENSLLRELKAIALSIDWEIDDEIMAQLIEQVEKLKDEYRDDNIILLFLRLLGSVGKYVKNNKANAHPDSIKLLNSVYVNLEKVIMYKDMPEAEREKALLGEVKKFKKLKKAIALKKAHEDRKEEPIPLIIEEKEIDIAAKKEPVTAPEAIQELGQPDVSHIPPHEAFAFAVEEIKKVIKAEFSSLRAELKLWREG